MSNLISTENLIKQAKKAGIEFGKGDPYNRLRYYTKIGWLPHMIRKKDKQGEVKGHYEKWVLDRLILIEELKDKGFPNEEISKRLSVRNKLQSFTSFFSTKEARIQVLSYISVFMLALILSNELEIISLGKPKSTLVNTSEIELPLQIMDSGTAFVPKGQKKLFIKTPLVKQTSKVYVSFNQDYSPATRYWTSTIKDYEGFEVELDAPVFNNTEFNWWVSN